MPKKSSCIYIYSTNIGKVIYSEHRPCIVPILKHSNVRCGSYAFVLIERIFHYIFGNAVDLKNEYQEYYKTEYNNINTFLYEKYCLNSFWIRKLSSKFDNQGFVGLVQFAWGRDWQIEHLIEDNEMSDVVSKIMNIKWVKNED
jgi:hypothetical protein